jgi:hypothetical protein
MRRLAFALAGVLAGCASHEPPPQSQDEGESAPRSPAEDPGGVALGARVQAAIEDAAAARPYVPSDAQYVVSLDVSTLAENEVVIAMWKKLLQQASADARDAFDVLEECGLDPHHIDRVVIAGNASRTAFSVLGDGAGDPDLYRCVARNSKERGDDGNDMEIIVGPKITKLVSKDYTGVLATDRMLVMADGDWGTKLAERFEAGDSGELQQPSQELAEVLAALPEEHPVRWATLMTSELAMFGRVRAASGSMFGENPLEAVAWFHADSTSEAESSRDQLRQMWSSMKSMLADPLTQPVVDSVEIDSKGQRVRISVSASKDDLTALSKKLGV